MCNNQSLYIWWDDEASQIELEVLDSNFQNETVLNIQYVIPLNRYSISRVSNKNQTTGTRIK